MTIAEHLFQLGEMRAVERADLAGRIHMCQEWLELPVTDWQDLRAKNIAEVRQLASSLKAQFYTRFHIDSTKT